MITMHNKEVSFKKIDAFASKNSAGNPAGMVTLKNKDDLSENEMLQIALELKSFVSEVAYLSPGENNNWNLRYYSSEREVDFCGHATIAVMYTLISESPELLEKETLTITTQKNTLSVENRIRDEDAVYISAPDPEYHSNCPPKNEIAEKLKITPGELSTKLPIAHINAGLNTLIVPINKLKTVLDITPELEELKSWSFGRGIDIITVFCEEVSQCQNDFRSRVFAPTFGYLEDPATGSGNSALGYYLLKNNLWKNESIRIEQNNKKNNFNIIRLKRQISHSGKTQLLFGGSAVTRIDGVYSLYHA